jgi:hypothetical protein
MSVNDAHQALLDDIAVYALGALPPAAAARVREHLKTCSACRQEYEALAPAVTAVGMSAEACPDKITGAVVPGPLLKARIMRQVRSQQQPARGQRPIVWPAYLVAAVCFAIALVTSLINLSIMQQLRQAQTDLSQAERRSTNLAHDLSDERTTMADLMSDDAKRYTVTGGQVVRVHDRIYIAMHDLPAPPHGKVYQAWTQAKGATAMSPSLTFIPDSRGVAIVQLPVSANGVTAVAVSVEPEGGSKQPTTKPILVTSLD